MLSQSFRINGPSVVHDTVDDEVVVINLETGSYYSLDGAGVDVWNMLGKGGSVSQIVDGLMKRYAGSAAEIEKSVHMLLTELRQEDLVRDVEGNHASGSAANGRDTNAEPSSKPQFKGFTFQKYTDLNHLLLLDPIHDVDEAGWPNARTGAPMPEISLDPQ